MKSVLIGCISYVLLFHLGSVGYAQPFTLPALTYSYDALEPSIDAQTMEIHHTRHHQAYVNNLNKAVTGTPMEKWSLDVLLLGASKRGDAIRNNGGGHYNHTLFWEILSPKAAKAPTGALAGAILETYGSLDSLKTLLNKAAATRFGSGWAWLLVTTDKKLMVSSSPNQDNPIMDVSPDRGLPILGIDVWEHAYYLKYQNKRGDYLASIWDVIDWKAVSDKYDAALVNPFLRRIERDSWKELNTFHEVMSQTFHPAEEGDLQPIKTRSGELAEKASHLKISNIPASFKTHAVRKSLDRLVAESASLDKLVRNKKDDKQIMKSLNQLHQRFHEVMEECDH
jgi:superoxide dismutase